MSKKNGLVRITGDACDVIIVRPSGRLILHNGATTEEPADLEARANVKVVHAPGTVEIEGDVSDVIIVEGEAIIFNHGQDDDEDGEEED